MLVYENRQQNCTYDQGFSSVAIWYFGLFHMYVIIRVNKGLHILFAIIAMPLILYTLTFRITKYTNFYRYKQFKNSIHIPTEFAHAYIQMKS